MIMCMLSGLFTMYLLYTVYNLFIMIYDEFFFSVEVSWKAANLAGKVLVTLYLLSAIPALVLYALGSLYFSAYSLLMKKSFPGLYPIKDYGGIKIVMPENEVLDLLRVHRIKFSIGDGFIRFPDNKTFGRAKEILRSYKIYDK